MIQVYNAIHNRHSLDSNRHLKKLQQIVHKFNKEVRYKFKTQKPSTFINTNNNQIKDITEVPAYKNISTRETLTYEMCTASMKKTKISLEGIKRKFNKWKDHWTRNVNIIKMS